MFTYDTFQKANNKCADQTARMRRLVCDCVLTNPRRQVFSRRGPFGIFCSNSNTLTFGSKVYIWNNLSGVKFIVIVSPLPLVGGHTKICRKILKLHFFSSK